MSKGLISERALASAAAKSTLLNYLKDGPYAARAGDPEICDFVLGNPHDMPLRAFVNALKTWVEPRDKNWFAYKLSEETAQQAVARGLRDRTGLPFEADDIAMTNGAFGAIATALQAFVDPGEEVIMNLPPWFNYEAMIRLFGATPVMVRVRADDLDLDVDAIGAAISAKTAMVIVNTPNNPTGRMYPAETLDRLAAVLTDASARHGRPILLLSDEPYSRLMFDGLRFISPAEHYPYTAISYSYGKALLTPGERIGWLALSPNIPDRAPLRRLIMTTQVSAGWLFPNATLQHAIEDLEAMSIDIDHLQRKRDRMIGFLREIGYQLHVPEGTFYLLPKCPIEDDLAFAESLASHNVYVLPGTICDIPGYFRISLTANDEMIDRSVEGFRRAFSEARSDVASSAAAS
ncbi:MAG: aminotransferase class I/II-fold pyridoxal phosphate-dependent enzyme [Alphaproteobacteria bacterium]|nr:aminotransferase class I/II-fold pyridoxal phosphate-dependent enzyme [Alphaproteobacteria bacterium]